MGRKKSKTIIPEKSPLDFLELSENSISENPENDFLKIENDFLELENDFPTPKKSKNKGSGYQRRKKSGMTEHAAAKQRSYEAKAIQKIRDAARECGEIGAPADPERRERCRLNLADFLRTYFPKVFRKPFSEDHLRVIAKHELAVLHGGRFVEAVYRGFGKTSIVEDTAIWAAVYGHRRFIPIICSDYGAAEVILDSIKNELLSNDVLGEDFPEISVPLRHSRGQPQRIAVQTHDGEPTNGEWTAEKIALPEIKHGDGGDYYPSSGNVILTASIAGRLRGMRHNSRGAIIRPDFCIIDDPQTDESAASPMQVEKRLQILKKTIFGLSGHETQMSVIIPATVIHKDDFVDQLLDHAKNPSWATERIKMVKAWAKAHDSLWMKEYRRIKQSFDPGIEGDVGRAAKAATEFYLANREAMDEGCVVSWEHCYEEGEVSAIQHAYNKLIDNGQEAFDSEYQNEPKSEEDASTQLTYQDVVGKLNRRKRGAVPRQAAFVTAFVDLQQESLFWTVCAWSQKFTGWVLDYGVYPEQPQSYFQISDMKNTLSRLYPGRGQEGLWHAGLTHVTKTLATREWVRDDGSVARIDRILIDANQGQANETVKTFVAESEFGAVLLPYISRGIGASERPMSEYHAKPGDRTGLNWRIPQGVGRMVRHGLVDVNFWKTFVKARWKTAPGDVGNLSLFGEEPDEHRLFVDHMLCERGIPVEGRGRRLEEWRFRRGNFTENHWWDGLVGCAAAASMCGAVLGGDNCALHGGKASGGFKVVDNAVLARMKGRK